MDTTSVGFEQGETAMPVAAFILIEVTGDHTKSAYKTIQRMAGAKACYMVSGSYDILVQVEAESLEALSDLLLSKIRSVDGVTKTTTSLVLNM
jgi:DNA-binding Lrp family transcriptional regulator